MKGGHTAFIKLVFAQNMLNGVMPTSSLDSIPGIEGLVFDRVKQAQHVHVWAHAQRIEVCLFCASARSVQTRPRWINCSSCCSRVRGSLLNFIFPHSEKVPPMVRIVERRGGCCYEKSVALRQKNMNRRNSGLVKHARHQAVTSPSKRTISASCPLLTGKGYANWQD